MSRGVPIWQKQIGKTAKHTKYVSVSCDSKCGVNTLTEFTLVSSVTCDTATSEGIDTISACTTIQATIAKTVIDIYWVRTTNVLNKILSDWLRLSHNSIKTSEHCFGNKNIVQYCSIKLLIWNCGSLHVSCYQSSTQVLSSTQL